MRALAIILGLGCLACGPFGPEPLDLCEVEGGATCSADELQVLKCQAGRWRVRWDCGEFGARCWQTEGGVTCVPAPDGGGP